MAAAAPDFPSVHERFRPRVVRYVTRMVGARDAEDLAQAVMLKVSHGLPEFRGDSNLATWIYRIATHTALDHLRRRTAPAPVELELESDDSELPPEAQAPSAEAAAIREEMNACVRDFIEHLAPDYKTVMVLSEIEGFKNAEIAGILEVSLDTVKIRLHRARVKLRKELEARCRFYRDPGDELACERKPPAVITFRRGR